MAASSSPLRETLSWTRHTESSLVLRLSTKLELSCLVLLFLKEAFGV